MHPKHSSNRQKSPTRASRRKQGLQPEFGLLPDKVKKEDIVTATMFNAGTMTSITLVLQQPWEPPSFRGSPGEDLDDWLHKVEGLRICNRWDDQESFWHVFFYFEDTTRTWFETMKAP